MNMHGIMTPIGSDVRRRETPLDQTRAWLWRHRMFLMIVVVPSLLLATYLYLFSSDQYESEAHFLVKSANVAEAPGTGVSQALSMVTGTSAAQSEAMSVADYLTSHDVVEELRKNDKLVERFHDRGADFTSALGSASPSPEKLLSYYRKQIKVNYSTETGITILKVHSFRPVDSYELARKLLELGERRVNTLNVRSYEDALAMSRRQLAVTENDLARAQGSLTNFRQSRRDIDPAASGAAQITLVSGLSSQLSIARAQLNAMGGMINPSSPQYRALAGRVTALQAQVSAQTGKLTGGGQAIAADISGFEDLRLRQQFLAKRYEAASASLDRARDQALRQQLYIVRVVDANMPVKALYPKRLNILATAVVALLLAYSIGWLIVAGVREHAA